MINLQFGQGFEPVVVTLNEKRTLDTGFYLFVFTHYTTKDIVNLILSVNSDESTYPDRFNQFQVSADVTFLSYDIGQWTYKVYEQLSGVNTDPTGLTELESGIMILKPATGFSFEEYTGATTYKQYVG